MKHEALLDQFERDIQQLRIEFERFFNGDLRIPPDNFRQELQNRARWLRSLSMGTAVERFRLQGLTARFNILTEWIQRRLNSDQQARVTARRAAAGDTHFDARAGVVLGDRMDADAVRSLYDALYRHRSEPKAGYAGFRNYLTRQLNSIRERTGCSDVRFRIEQKNNQLTLRAKPVRDERTS